MVKSRDEDNVAYEIKEYKTTLSHLIADMKGHVTLAHYKAICESKLQLQQNQLFEGSIPCFVDVFTGQRCRQVTLWWCYVSYVSCICGFLVM